MQTTKAKGRVTTGGLCHIAIDVTDLENSVRFYTDMFNLEVVDRTDSHVQLKTPGGRDSFFLFKANAPVNPRGCGQSHAHFGFRVDDQNFDVAMDYIRRNNIKIHPNPRRSPGRFVYIEDPDGYVIQLEPGDCD
ncbi:VOC family protein [Methanocella arvoryzae]|nr:VOC family protein [Methanocella arvoryzae]